MPEVASPHTVELLSMHVSSGLETHTKYPLQSISGAIAHCSKRLEKEEK